MPIPETISKAVADHITIPPHIAACASACRYDLYHGPCFSRVPPEGIEAFTVDHYATFASDLEDLPGETTETYVGPVGDALRGFLDGLPSKLFVDAEAGCILEREPEGEYLNAKTMEPCDSDAEGAEYFEPGEYYELDHGDIVEALFGKTIAREFS